MTYLFSKILEMSLYGSIAIGAVMIFRAIFRKCPRRVLIIFWLAVAFRLICPFNFSSPTSVLNIARLLPSKAETSAEDVLPEQTAEAGQAVLIGSGEQAVNNESNETAAAVPANEAAGESSMVAAAVPENEAIAAAVPADETAARASVENGSQSAVTNSGLMQSASVSGSSTREVPQTNTVNRQTSSASSELRISASDVIPYVWFFVSYCMLVFFTVRYIAFYRTIKKGFRKDDGTIHLDEIDSPFVIGFFKPVLCVPSKFNDLEKDYILRHENLHIKNHDGLIKLVCYLILCVHWFNPLVWAAFLMVCADLEMRVDEEVIEGLGIEMKKAYCRSIVNHAVNDPEGSFMQNTAFSGMGFGGMEAKMRVTNLLKNKKVSKQIQAAAIVLSLTVAVMASACSFDFGNETTSSEEETEVTVNGIESEGENTEQTASQTETETEAETTPDQETETTAAPSTAAYAPVVSEVHPETGLPVSYYDGLITVRDVGADPFMIRLPQINLYSDEIAAVNDEIYAVYTSYDYTGVTFDVFHFYDGVYSIVINYSYEGWAGCYRTYTFNTDGHVLNGEETAALAGISGNDFYDTVLQGTATYMNDTYYSWQNRPLIIDGMVNPDFELDEYMSQMLKDNISHETINFNMNMYINGSGELCIMQTIFPVADAHDCETFISVPEGVRQEVGLFSDVSVAHEENANTVVNNSWDIYYVTEDGRFADTSFTQPYLDVIADQESAYPGRNHYDLVFIDSDNIPELVISRLGTDDLWIVSLFTLRNGEAVNVIDEYQYDQTFTNRYQFIPFTGYIDQYEYVDALTEYIRVYTLDDLINGWEPTINAHSTLDIEEDTVRYYIGDNEASYEDYPDFFRQDPASVRIHGEYTLEEITYYITEGIVPTGLYLQ